MELTPEQAEKVTGELATRVKLHNHMMAIDTLLDDAASIPDDLEASLYVYREQVAKGMIPAATRD